MERIELSIEETMDVIRKNRPTSGYAMLNTALDMALEALRKQLIFEGWQPISEYDREEYDWVLVKYYDGDYECIPVVAEQRTDGKWYDQNAIEIPFEVRYFFDIQQLDGIKLEG